MIVLNVGLLPGKGDARINNGLILYVCMSGCMYVFRPRDMDINTPCTPLVLIQVCSGAQACVYDCILLHSIRGHCRFTPIHCSHCVHCSTLAPQKKPPAVSVGHAHPVMDLGALVEKASG